MKLMGIDLQHMGKKPEKAEKSSAPEPTNPVKEHFPNLYLSGDQVPNSLKSAKHDDQVIVVAKCRIVSVGTQDGEKGKTYNIDLELQEVGIKPYSKKKISEMDEEEATEALNSGTAVDED